MVKLPFCCFGADVFCFEKLRRVHGIVDKVLWEVILAEYEACKRYGESIICII